ncbi:MAG: adenosylcobinamide-phosphate synthase CbiB [Syntrophales bacterium]|nr:adenosylcobinamide-phosphate synthase CbiB [Syntrophales bacterium]MDP3097498.1 adenosylcobinamide-phosphate synthase CbiB [Syntrophales bacterium]
MRLEYQIAIALLLDLSFGDPRWLPHPVRLIGRLIAALEEPARRAIPDARLAGSLTALAVILTAVLATGAMIGVAGWVHPRLGDAVSILLLYTTLAARDLANHSNGVYRALARFDLAEARRLVSWLVGRDTERLTEPEVVRAAVESVAENTVDGIIAPLFFAALGGPIAAMAYKAASTLDSMIGYRNERYIDFGRTAAEIDDGANWLPARLAVPIITAAAALTGQNASAAWRIARRDGRKHMSPNAGIAEAAFAGALGIRLGGVMQRRGRPVNLPEIGDPVVTLARGKILAANRMMYAATGIAVAVFLAARWGITALMEM